MHDYKTITSYDTMPIGVYLRILDAATEHGTADGDLAIIAAYADMTVDELTALPLPQYLDIRSRAAFLAEQPAPAPMREQYQVGPFLCNVAARADQLTAGQYIDIKEFGALEGDQTVEVLSALLVPDGHRYNEGYDLEALRGAIRDHLPITEAVAIRDFFCVASARSMLASLRSSAKGLPLLARIKMHKTIQRARTALAGLSASGSGPGGRTSSLTLPALLGMRHSPARVSSSSRSAATTRISRSGRSRSTTRRNGKREGGPGDE